MKVIRNPEKLNKLIKALSSKGRSVGFVPTMGALHLGHLSLIKQALKENNIVVVSIFVNPTQFGPKEDLKKYPRPLKKDLQLCGHMGVDFVFLPDEKTMYPKDFSTFVHVERLSELLCGVSRLGHFRAVTTIITKMLNIIEPRMLYLGQKDAQQAVIIKKMVSDLNFPVKVRIMPTIRQKNGLALSSRNLYLNPTEIKLASVLWEALNKAKKLIESGRKDYSNIIVQMKKMIVSKGSIRIDYISIVDLNNLKLVNKESKRILIVLAVWINKIRLIDNLLVHKK